MQQMLDQIFEHSDSTVVTVLLASVVLVTIVLLYLRHVYSYWERRGIPGPPPVYLFGHVYARAMKLSTVVDMEWKAKYGNVYGIYTGTLPTLSISDSELIKQVLVKDFYQFSNRRKLNSHDKFWNINLFFLEYDHWKQVRTVTSPLFSSRKLRSMNGLMAQSVDKLCNYLDQLTNNGPAIFGVKEVIAGFTVDVVATTTLGVETDANNCDKRHTSKLSNCDQQSTSSIVKIALDFWAVNKFYFIMSYSFGFWLNKLFRIKRQFNDESYSYFVQLVQMAVRERTKNSYLAKRRSDLIQLLVEASISEQELRETTDDRLTASGEHQDIAEDRNSSSIETNRTFQSTKRKLTENEIIAQCLVFFVAGFETTASTIAFTLYELAHNPDIQQCLYKEIQSALQSPAMADKSSDQYYDQVMGQIPYLDAVIKETMRKYPTVVRLERRVTADRYRLGGIELRRGQLVEIPIYAVHHNPEYFSKPERFDPDRFMPENKDKLVPYSYLPFGAGPRNCIGLRFAYQEIKLALASIVARYRFELTDATKIELVPSAIVLNAESFPLKVARR